MKSQKIIFPLLTLLLVALACNFPSYDEWCPNPFNPVCAALEDDTPSTQPPPDTDEIVIGVDQKYGYLTNLYVEPGTGYGPFRATLHYGEGKETSYATCAYAKKDDLAFVPVIIGVLTLNPGSGLMMGSQTMDFNEKRPAQYLAYCTSGEQRLEQSFAVVSPYVGQYECESCFSESWATDVDMVAEGPRSMGRNLVKITVDENGNVTAGYIFYEIYGTPPNYCTITYNSFESGKVTGAVNHDTKELIVDFLDCKAVYERSGGSQCDPPEVSTGGATRFFFQFNEQGDLMLCKPFETGQSCIENPIAVLLKRK
ncbi:MAG: hypothetical protein AB1345_08600 [Chloroflexota bacterium]